jgi:hypothetical protein
MLRGNKPKLMKKPKHAILPAFRNLSRWHGKKEFKLRNLSRHNAKITAEKSQQTQCNDHSLEQFLINQTQKAMKNYELFSS